VNSLNRKRETGIKKVKNKPPIGLINEQDNELKMVRKKQWKRRGGVVVIGSQRGMGGVSVWFGRGKTSHKGETTVLKRRVFLGGGTGGGGSGKMNVPSKKNWQRGDQTLWKDDTLGGKIPDNRGEKIGKFYEKKLTKGGGTETGNQETFWGGWRIKKTKVVLGPRFVQGGGGEE